MKRIIILLVLVVLSAQIFAEQNQKYYLYNENTHKLYPYYELEAGETIEFDIRGRDSLIVYSRLVINDKYPSDYKYLFSTGNYQEEIERKVRPSTATRGVSGDKVSSWNSFRYYVIPQDEVLKITNQMNLPVLVKISDKKNGVSKRKTKSDFIAYPPEMPVDVVPVEISGRVYDYYNSLEEGINIRLQGPLQLKVITRLIVKEVETLNYEWEALLDGEDFVKFEEISPYSSSALADESSIVTKGMTRILQIPDGIHTIEIKDVQPEAIIYRFYLDKSSIGNKQ